MGLSKTKRVFAVCDVDTFFAKARAAARRADQKQDFEGRLTLSFEDPHALSRFTQAYGQNHHFTTRLF
jgi:hypothetical protein